MYRIFQQQLGQQQKSVLMGAQNRRCTCHTPEQCFCAEYALMTRTGLKTKQIL